MHVFRTDAGVKHARATDDGRIALWFGAVEDGEAVTLGAIGRTFAGRRVVAGVPHFVVPVPRLDTVPLSEWAPPLRAHTRLGPAGANVDFVSRTEDVDDLLKQIRGMGKGTQYYVPLGHKR